MLRILAVSAISMLILAAYDVEAQDRPQAAPELPESLRQLPEARQEAPASTQAPPENAGGRYRMSEVEGGILRLDSWEGRVSYCHRDRGDWICELVADDRAAYEAEIGRLAEENQRLKDDLAALQERDDNGKNVIELPSREDVDRLMTFFDQMMRRLLNMMKSLSEEGPEERTGAAEPGPGFPPVKPHAPADI